MAQAERGAVVSQDHVDRLRLLEAEAAFDTAAAYLGEDTVRRILADPRQGSEHPSSPEEVLACAIVKRIRYLRQVSTAGGAVAEAIAREIGDHALAAVLRVCHAVGKDCETLLIVLYGRLLQRRRADVLSVEQLQDFERRLGLDVDTFCEWRRILDEALR